jgi:outer membrane protein TolC
MGVPQTWAQVPPIRWKKQANLGEAAPAIKVLTLQDFLARVVETHPLIKQAVLYQKLSHAKLQEARGGFDPKVGLINNRKWLGGDKYYDVNEFKTVVPLRSGLNIMGGYEYASGSHAPNEYTLDKGIYFGGIEWQAGRGLLLDARRAGVLQGKNEVLLGSVYMRQYANKVLSQAAKEYWAFYYAYNEAQYLYEGVELAATRHEGVTLKFKVGEEAAIDTVEAEILFQDRSNQYLEALNEMRNARLALQAYIWGEAKSFGYDPMDSLTIPEKFTLTDVPFVSADVQEGINRILENNPNLASRRLELKQLDIDKKLAMEYLRPQVDIKYQFLSKEGSGTWGADQPLFKNNYRFGVDMGMPIFLRKERGKLAQIKIKTEQNRLALQQVERDAEVEYRQLRNDLTTYRQQIATQESMVANYRVLRNGEAIKFSMGESSLFLVNTRESKLIEGEIKLAALHSKWQKSRIELLFLAGALIDAYTLPVVK